MNISKLIAGAVLAAGILLSNGTVDAEERQTYLLLCKGGNNSFEMYSKMHSITSTARVSSTFMKVNFKRSRQAASAGLNAGSCAWADRGVHADEPAVLKLTFAQVWVVINSETSGSRQTVAYDVHGRGDIAEDLSALLRALQNGGDFQVHAYNDKDGALVVSKYGP